MKKGLVLGLIGLGSLFTLVGGVKAETLDLTNVSTTGQTVTVGEVDAPVYSVDITWGDLTFDYEYNQVTSQYYWRAKKECVKLVADDGGYNKISWINNEYDLYLDDQCKNEYNKETFNLDFEGAVEAELYYAAPDYEGAGYIQIKDNSTNAQIVPSILWQSESKYDFVDAKFQYETPEGITCKLATKEEFEAYAPTTLGVYTDSNCTVAGDRNATFEEGKYYISQGGGVYYKDLNTEKLPTEARQYPAGGPSGAPGVYFLSLSLVNNPAKEAKMPVKGDKIGTVTINIDAA